MMMETIRVSMTGSIWMELAFGRFSGHYLKPDSLTGVTWIIWQQLTAHQQPCGNSSSESNSSVARVNM
jgi:hypothetical protein